MAMEIEIPVKNKRRVPTETSTVSGTALAVTLRKSFQNENGDFVLDVNFSVAEGFTILFGASGAGKTTLLNCIAGLELPDNGRITIGTDVLFDSARNASLPAWKRRVGYVFQELALFPHLTAEQNITYGLSHPRSRESHDLALALARTFRIDHLLGRRPAEISGGERQRVALARALITNPRVLLLDEPLAALDAATKSHIRDDLRRWNAAHQIPIIYVTHSRDEVFALGERVLLLAEGRMLAEGTPHQVMTAPREETVAQLAGFENIFDATVAAIHEDRGTMTCRLGESRVELETPLVRAKVGSKYRVGIRAGDILLATQKPIGLSARNVIPARVAWMVQRDMIVVVKVDCGVEAEVHVTLLARDSLQLAIGREVWLVVKTHSCHLMAR
jgi:molybdate transport system ATP-binding protein